MRQLPCPHCYETPNDLDSHLKFDCPKLVGRSRYTPPADLLPVTLVTTDVEMTSKFVTIMTLAGLTGETPNVLVLPEELT